jgi:uncharacterized protein YprB with RNaseH-like and TPR domain
MNYATENISPIVFDIETCGIDNAADYLEPVQAAKNLKDPEKVSADIAQRTSERDAKLALDYNVGRICAIAWWTQEAGTECCLCPDEATEEVALRTFWATSKHRTLVGFNIKSFDLRFLTQRSRFLNVPYPRLDLGKYSKQGITDLFLDLTFGDGQYDQGAMRRTLHAFCRRFGIAVTDTITGADIPALVAANDWASVEAHVCADVALELALAQRLGIIVTQPEVAGVL